jgi:hypothetical protein
MVILIKYLDTRFDIEISDNYGKLVVSLFKRRVSREIKEDFKLICTFKILLKLFIFLFHCVCVSV